LELGWKVHQAGHPLEFSPEVEGKRPDLKARIAERDVFLEVTVMGPSEAARRADETIMRLTQPFLVRGEVHIAGRIHKTLSTLHLEELEGKILEAIRKVVKENRCIEFIEPGVIHYFIAPWNKREEVLAWQERHGIQGVEGPPIEGSEIWRIQTRLREKCKQLPSGQPGMIVIFAGLPYLVLDSEDQQVGYAAVADKLEETVYENRDLMAGVLMSRYLGGSEEAGIFKVPGKPDHILIKTSYHGVLQTWYLIISNRFSRHQLTNHDLAIFLK